MPAVPTQGFKLFWPYVSVMGLVLLDLVLTYFEQATRFMPVLLITLSLPRGLGDETHGALPRSISGSLPIGF